MAVTRIIMHVDMDAFYASVEQRDFPELRGKPVIVGGSPAERGVVAASSYEARKFGVRSAMPTSQALRECPEAILRAPRFSAYREASQAIHVIFRELTEKIEPVSLDEAYLDLTGQVMDFQHALSISRRLKKDIHDRIDLTASVGVGPNKFLAKVASDYRKPDGLFIIKPEEALNFLEPLPVRVIPGVGPKTDHRLKLMEIRTIGQLRERAVDELQEFLGRKHGERLHQLAQGMDDAPVVSSRTPKSVSQERTFTNDLSNKEEMNCILTELAEMVSQRLKKKKLKARTIGIKVRFEDFRIATRSNTIGLPSDEAGVIAEIANGMLDRLSLQGMKVRLLGVRSAGFHDPDEVDAELPDREVQLRLW
ncbi:MAG: DNA polymerase IV [Candidatus Hinthialibacter antarcticus]|nr:DNA polymerase IV [Candidatus Hinthialibacter antarcticus]